jgi:hypothetical protein
METDNDNCPFELKELDSIWNVNYKDKDLILMKINKRLDLEPKHYFQPYFRLINGIWYIIYIDNYKLFPDSYYKYTYTTADGEKTIFFNTHCIIRTNLSYLINIINITYLPSYVALTIIKYIDIDEITDAINVQRHRNDISYRISDDKNFIDVTCYNGYNANVTLYSLRTFKELKTPMLLVTHSGDIEYKGNEIMCTLKEYYCHSIGKWDFPDWSYGGLYHETETSADNIVLGNAYVRKNYYTYDDINILRNFYNGDIDQYSSNEFESKVVERYVFNYVEETNSLEITEHYIDVDFYEIFQYAVRFNDYR